MEKVRGTNRRCFSDRYYDVVILGAIEIYKRTGSHTILQQAMGHASLAAELPQNSVSANRAEFQIFTV